MTAAVARLPESELDAGLLRLGRSADFAARWLAIAAALGTRAGEQRRAAVRGVASLGGAALIVNAGLKPIVARRRPAADLLPARRRSAPPPASSSFPSGHSAAAAAFATGAALESPRTALFLVPLAAVVSYSRVHTGVHWGSDVLAGAIIGSAVAVATRHWWPSPVPAATRERPSGAPALTGGAGLLVLVNPAAGGSVAATGPDLAALLPEAMLVKTGPGDDPADRLERAYRACPRPPSALGGAGGGGGRPPPPPPPPGARGGRWGGCPPPPPRKEPR
ncbi:phosphatase PAP2 family protein, partial [Nocardia tengchongensis]|uniref:phosphatase PAP2 family protein n=1 Tax=Nocardia tengchongensis TaxID=2055889 RepID=UPI003698F68F